MKNLSIFPFIICLLLSLHGSLATASDDNQAFEVPININTASAESLAAALKGVGISKAQAIISYRESYGEFKSVDELMEVKGIGQSLLDTNRQRITLN